MFYITRYFSCRNKTLSIDMIYTDNTFDNTTILIFETRDETTIHFYSIPQMSLQNGNKNSVLKNTSLSESITTRTF